MIRSLYWRLWLTVVLAVAVFAALSATLMQRHVNHERDRVTAQAGGERLRALGDLLGPALPEAQAPAAVQAAALQEWSDRLRLPLALDDAQGQRLATSLAFGRLANADGPPPVAVTLDDGRRLWMLRPPRPRGGPPAGAGLGAGPWGNGGLLLGLLLLFGAVALGAYPVVRRLTRRLEALQQGVERFGQGALGQRVADEGHDEVARLARSFNRAAQHIEALVQSHSHLVAHASHELRSPLARLKMALGLWAQAGSEGERQRLRAEVDRNLGELDALIEELLMSSRLQAAPVPTLQHVGPAALSALLNEEAARVQAVVHTGPSPWPEPMADERLLRRALRNLLENARRYGGHTVEVVVASREQRLCIQVLDRGPGVPEPLAEAIFEPFFRLPGHAESAGGVGLGLNLVRQIARHHGGDATVRPREGGGSCFELSLPLGRG